MAEYLARELSRDDEITFASAGTGAGSRAEPSDGTREVMEELGIDVAAHRSRSVWDLGVDGDVVYALSAEHREEMVSRWPERADDIHLLRADGGSIADPYGLDVESYRQTRDEIETAVRDRIASGWHR